MSFIPIHATVRYSNPKHRAYFTKLQVMKDHGDTFDAVIVSDPDTDMEGELMVNLKKADYEVISWGPDAKLNTYSPEVALVSTPAPPVSKMDTQSLLALGLI